MVRVTVVPAGTDPADAPWAPAREASGNPGFGESAEAAGQPHSAPWSYGGWMPRVVLGAPAPGGLLLPPAQPTAAWLYGPRAAWVDDEVVIVADTGNHRVLIWHAVPDHDGAPADVVLGQPDEVSEGPAAGGRGPANGMYLPTGVLRAGGRLVVADAWHHRLLVWNTLPTRTGTPPDVVIGQPSATEVEPNSGGEPTDSSFYWPFGIALIDGRFHVADTGNRRVLIWNDGIPEPGQPADVVLGQPSPSAREENRGGPVAADSFRWPHAFATMRGTSETGDTDDTTGRSGLWVADAGNHRILGWDSPPERDRPADRVLGQADLVTGTEFPYVPQVGRLRFPYGIASAGGELAVADTANNRILVHDRPHESSGEPFGQFALGQPDLAANGENRWDAVAADTLCWPYGLHWHRSHRGGVTRDVLAVADSGNNRVVLWERR